MYFFYIFFLNKHGVQVFVCMNAEYTFIHMSCFPLNSFVHSVLNKCPNSNVAVFHLKDGLLKTSSLNEMRNP